MVPYDQPEASLVGSWTSRNWFFLLPFPKGFVREVDIRHLSHLGLRRRFPSRGNEAYSVQNLSRYSASMAYYDRSTVPVLYSLVAA
jgi:hypothetical protein